MLPRRLFYDTLFDDDMMKGMDADVYLKDGVYHIEVDIPGFNKEDIKIETHKGTLKDGVYHIEVDIPGFNKEDIKIETHKGTVTIKAEKEYKEDSDDKKYIRHERKYNSLERSFYFGDIDEDLIKAEFINGTLHLTIPQKAEEAKKQITID